MEERKILNTKDKEWRRWRERRSDKAEHAWMVGMDVRTYYEHKKVTAYGWHDVDILMNL